jgi:hypothetical protein
MRMCVSYLCDEREQHANHDDTYVALGHAVIAGVCVHIAICGGVFVRVLRSCDFGHGVHGDISVSS